MPSISLADTDQYYYNGSNQLVQIVNDTSSRVVTYSYDANGSVVAVNSVAVSALTISGFTPAAGAVGSQVTIYGTGFDPVPANNIVAINGTSTLVSSASATQLVTSVPTGASTGKITVSNPTGSAVSAANFVVSGSGGGTGGPIATVAPGSLAFLSQGVGSTSASKAITLTNTGAADLHFSSPVLFGAHANDFSVSSSSCSSALIANASCTINVTFTPAATGNRSAAVIVLSDSTNGAQSVPLSGMGAIATATAAPSALTYADQLINTTSIAQNVTVTNSGGSPLIVSGLTLAGTNSGDFAVSNNGCSAAVAAGASCVISVTFRPTATGARSGSLQVASNSSNGVQQVSLAGTGTAPAASMSPSSLAFGNQLIGTTSTARSLTVTNSGTAPLTVSAPTVGGVNPADYAISGNSCTGAVAIGQSCIINVTFAPSVTGSSTAMLQVSTDAATGTQWISLSGTGIAPLISVAPTSNAYGNVLINTTSAAKIFTVTNSGSAPLTVGMLSFSGANASDFTISSVGCAGTLSVGANCTISVTFHPAATGARVASLQIQSDANNGAQQISLTGTGIAPAASATPTSLAFGNQLLSTISTAKVVTVTSTGSSALTVATVSLSGTNASDYTISSNGCTAAVAVGANCTITVTFNPAAVGSRIANLQIASDANNGAQQVSLTGSGVTPVASATPTSLAYGNQLLGTTSTAKVVTVTNTGSSVLTVGTVSLSGTNAADFTITSNACTTAVAVGANCTINVTFRPAAVGALTASLQIPSDSNNGTQQVSLSGIGIAPVASATPTSLTFGDQLLGATSTAKAVMVTNTGSSPLTVGTLSFSGASAADFVISSNACTTAVAVGANCTINVTFNPTAVGSRVASLQIPSDANNGTQTVSLTGTGTAPIASMTPSSLTFGNQLLSTTSTARSLTVTNSGTAPLTVGSVGIGGINPGDYTIFANTCTGAVAVSQSCTISVTFAPTVTSSRSATLQVSTDAATGTQWIALSGTGIAPLISVAPTSNAFGGVLINTTSATKIFTVTNTGTAPLTVGMLSLSGANASDFTIANADCTGALSVGSNCTISVTFHPVVTGARIANLQIQSDANNGAQLIALTGMGIAPAASATPTSLAFGNQLLATTSVAKIVTVTNTGSAPLAVGAPTLSGANAGDFTFVGNTCSGAVAAAQTCSISITFTPGVTGSRSATLTIPSDATNGAQTVSLSGTGTLPAASVAPSSISFGNQLVGSPSSSQSVTVTNTGTAPLHVGTLSFSGTNAGNYAVANNGCSSAVEPSATCTLTVTFNPSVMDSSSATLNIVSDATNGTQTVSLSGTGIAPMVTIYPSTRDFGLVLVSLSSNPMYYGVKNSGTAPLQVGTLSFAGTNPGDFIITSSTCNNVVAPGLDCSVGVKFKPAHGGARSATLQVPSNAFNGTQTSGATGTALGL
ncbi:beta strand repeat-containing protein [Stenotrophobium rhamnosiphilum]|nr:choice-of-anchor D domain-containing protein [Stenotrophobium rhamnosiphilum]